jgi:hypothetical protein
MEKYKTMDPKLLEMLAAKNEQRIMLAFSMAKHAGHFEQAFRAFLNIYYPRGTEWVSAAWNNFKKHGISEWVIAPAPFFVFHFDTQQSMLKIKIMGISKDYNINKEWSMGSINELIKKCIIHEFMPHFYAVHYGAVIKSMGTPAPMLQNQLNLFE